MNTKRARERSPPGQYISIVWEAYQSSVLNKLRTLYRSNTFVDCTLSAEGHFIKAHKLLLSACSPYFEAIFEQEKDGNPHIIMRDVKYKYLKIIVDFVYSGTVKICESDISSFLEVARSLQIKGLDCRYTEPEHKQMPERAPRKRHKERWRQNPQNQELSNENDIEVIDIIRPKEPSQLKENCSDALNPIIESTYSMALDSESKYECLSDDVGQPVRKDLAEPEFSVTPGPIISSAAMNEGLNEIMETERHENNISVNNQNLMNDVADTVSSSNRSIRSSHLTSIENIEEDTHDTSFEEKKILLSGNIASNVDLYPTVRLEKLPWTSSGYSRIVRLPPEDDEETVIYSDETSLRAQSPLGRRSRGHEVKVRAAGIKRENTPEPLKGTPSLRNLVLKSSPKCPPSPVVINREPLCGATSSTTKSSDMARPALFSKPTTAKVTSPLKTLHSSKRTITAIVHREDEPEETSDVEGGKEQQPQTVSRTDKSLSGKTPRTTVANHHEVKERIQSEEDFQQPQLGTRTSKKPTSKTSTLLSNDCEIEEEKDNDQSEEVSEESGKEDEEEPANNQQPTTSSQQPWQGSEGKKRHTCTVCLRKFQRPYEMTVHFRRHTGERPFRCETCLKSFAQAGCLRRHLRVHTGEKPFKCKICKRSFARFGYLKVHMRLHTGETPYECPDCDKRFATPSHLWSHRRVHMVGNYECDACGMLFRRKDHLRNHWFDNHEGQVYTGPREVEHGSKEVGQAHEQEGVVRQCIGGEKQDEQDKTA